MAANYKEPLHQCAAAGDIDGFEKLMKKGNNRKLLNDKEKMISMKSVPRIIGKLRCMSLLMKENLTWLARFNIEFYRFIGYYNMELTFPVRLLN